MADYVSEDCAVVYSTTPAVAAGAVVVMADLIGVANRPIAAGGTGSVDIDGIHSMPKAAASSGASISQGAIVYWDATAGNITTTASGNKRAGKAAADAASAATTVRVILNCG